MTEAKYDKIKAWACFKKGEELKEHTYEAAPLQDNDVEIKITHCGICGSDLHVLDSEWGDTEYPCITGHEIVGHVTAKGSRVTDLNVGDRVAVGAQCAACLQPDCFGCGAKHDAQCPQRAWTYGDRRFIDGTKTYGGYAEAIRVQADYAFKLPEDLPSEFAAPLMCAGVTVFSPMLRHKIKSGDRVGVVGVGGLGHLAIKFAKALGAHVVALSRNASKQKDAIDLGADEYIAYQDENEAEKVKNSLSFLFITAKVTGDPNQWYQFSSWMALEGRVIVIDVPKNPFTIPPFALLNKNLSVTGSQIGSIDEIKETLRFAAANDIKPWIEQFDMKDANKALNHFRDGKARFRIVLKN